MVRKQRKIKIVNIVCQQLRQILTDLDNFYTRS